MQGAIGRQAEQLFQSLPPAAQAAWSEIVPLLVTVEASDKQAAVRRRASLAELRNTAARQQLVEALIAGRFLTTDQFENHAVCSLAHEALLKQWLRLRDWVNQNRQLLQMRSRVELSQQRWEQNQQDDSLLLPPGVMLEEGCTLLAQGRSMLSPPVAEYITASVRYQEQLAIRERRTRHLIITALALVLLVLAGIAYEWNGRVQAQRVRDRILVDAPMAELPGVMENAQFYRRWLNPLLKQGAVAAESNKDAGQQLRASLALLPVDNEQMEYLLQRLRTAAPQELLAMQVLLAEHKAEISAQLWPILENSPTDPQERLRVACVLAALDASHARWEKVAPDVANALVMQKPFEISDWTTAIQPVASHLLPTIAGHLVDENRSVSERDYIVTIYEKFAAHVPEAYSQLEAALEIPCASDANAEAKLAWAKRQASLGTALLAMGHGANVWPLLKHQPDPTVSSFLIERLAPGGVDPQVLWSQLENEPDATIRRATLLALSEFGLDKLSLADRNRWLPRLSASYRDDPDAGIHGAAELLLKRWQAEDKMKEINKELATGKVVDKRQWYINSQGQTFTLITAPQEFWYGEGAERKREKIAHNFAIANKEVTVEQFQRFRQEQEPQKDYSAAVDPPMNNVNWYDAAAYCNWLSEQEGLPKEQWCYVPNENGEFAEGMKFAPNFLKCTGYRLPTEVEWEYACRAGSETGYGFGETGELLEKYACFDMNSLGKTHAVGSLKPNALGLFDLHGNLWEWCSDLYEPQESDDSRQPVKDDASRVLRGGAFHDPALVRSAYRNIYRPTYRNLNIGFRPARTYP